ncbi:MAG: DUF4291 domain-containing protein [Luteolibacter sp.]
MRFERYLDQVAQWPQNGHHILAQYDEQSIIVYQAYRSSIAAYAVKHQAFGGEFSYNRMSWIKPNFLWMMYRSGWAGKEGQEHILAVTLRRDFFDHLLREVVPSRYLPSRYPNEDAWKTAVASSDVRLQWDPDHSPTGHSLERRAVQLGLRGKTLHHYGKEAILSIEDITPFVVAQRHHADGDFSQLITPEERIYIPDDELAAIAVGIDR